jgi:hypothetical protein
MAGSAFIYFYFSFFKSQADSCFPVFRAAPQILRFVFLFFFYFLATTQKVTKKSPLP